MTWTCQLSAEDAGDWTTAPTWVSGDVDAEWAVYVVALATQDAFREERNRSRENVSARRSGDEPRGGNGRRSYTATRTTRGRLPASWTGGFG